MLENTVSWRAVLVVVLVVLSGLATTNGVLSFSELRKLSVATGGSASTSFLAPFSVMLWGAAL